jgi:predicted Zn-dependent peptidase
VSDAFMETAFSHGQAIGRPILGRPETIRSFTAEAIRAFMAREYVPSRMVFAAAGPLEHEAIVEAVSRHFGDLAPAEPPPAEPGRYTGGERRLNRKLEQANVMLGLPGLSFKDPGFYALHLFAHLLGGG